MWSWALCVRFSAMSRVYTQWVLNSSQEIRPQGLTNGYPLGTLEIVRETEAMKTNETAPKVAPTTPGACVRTDDAARVSTHSVTHRLAGRRDCPDAMPRV